MNTTTYRNPEGAKAPVVIASTPMDNLYLGRMPVIPRKKDTMYFGAREYRVERVRWSYNDGPGEWEVTIDLDYQ